MDNSLLIKTLSVALLGINLLAFALYGYDKSMAKKGMSRIRERTLLFLALLGGWPASIAGQRLFRHKTRKKSFVFRFYLIVCAHILAALIWFIFIRADVSLFFITG